MFYHILDLIYELLEPITEKAITPINFILILQVETIDDYDEYCHYVAGLVGLGLSKLFRASGKEDVVPDDLSNSMGLFLQVFHYMEQQCVFSPASTFDLKC